MLTEELKTVFRQMAAEAAELKAAVGGPLTDVAADWLVPQYLISARAQLAGLTDDAERMKALRLTANDLVALRRGDHSAARLVLDRERLAVERVRAERDKEAEFWKWTKKPAIRRKLWPRKKRGITKRAWREMERAMKIL